MKRKLLLKTGLLGVLAAFSLCSFLYLNVLANPAEEAALTTLAEEQIMEPIEDLEAPKALPEAFLLEQIIKIAKNLIP